MQTNPIREPRPASRIRWIPAAAVVAFGVIVAGARAIFISGEHAQPQRARVNTERPSPIAEQIYPVPQKIAAAPAPVESSKPGERSYSSDDQSTDWSVIAATHNSREAAGRHARNLKALWSECECRVYPPEGEPGPGRFFVLLGKGLSRTDADRLRDRATGAGLPPDTYVTKLIQPASRARSETDTSQ